MAQLVKMSSVVLTPRQRAFIRKCTDFFTEAGLARSISKTLSYLIVCEPPKQTAAQIQQALGLSAGSVSTATTVLKQIGLIDMVKMPGERRLYYEVKPDAFTRTIKLRVKLIAATKDLAEEGLNSDPSNKRLMNMRDAYAQLEKAVSEAFKGLH